MRFTVLGFICAVFMVSCAEDEIGSYTVGSDFIDSDIEVKVIDTFTINTGMFKLDSLITSSTSRILLGSINDDYLGKVTAQSYFQVNSSLYSISSAAVYDSIGFILDYDTYYYGDTLQPQTYKIHEVLETVNPKGDATEFYNTSTLMFEDQSLGEVTFIPRPHIDSIYIPMKYELGEEIFNKIVDNEINNSDDFIQYFKGLTIVSDETSNSHILGFNADSYITNSSDNNSRMRLYYTLKNEDTGGVSYYVDFLISSAATQFNNIKTDLSATNIEDVNNFETIVSSEETNHLIYAQAGTGISARINIPSIKRLKEMSELGTSLGAVLSFKPLKGTYNDYNPLKDSLSVYIVDHKNRILNLLTSVDGNTAYALLNKNDDEFDSNTYYSIDLGGFVEEILRTEADLNYSLMIQFRGLNNSVDRVIIQDPNVESDRVKLTVKYLKY